MTRLSMSPITRRDERRDLPELSLVAVLVLVAVVALAIFAWYGYLIAVDV